MAGATDPATKWLQQMQSPTTAQNYTNGVQGYNGNPMQAAADQQALYLQNVTDAVNSGRMKAALLATPVATWKTNSTTKGAGRISAGAAAAQQKVVQHFQKFGPVYAAIKQQVSQMPKGGMANSLARVQAAITALKTAAGKPVN
jgi:hypothetical protein